MPDWTLADLLAGTRCRLAGGAERPIGGFSIDTRTLKPGDVFIAIKGENMDGHDFIPKAVAGGAAAVISHSWRGGQPPDAPERTGGGPLPPAWIQAEDPLLAMQNLAGWHRQRHTGRFLGVTGSNGKTTTKEMLQHLFSSVARTWATAGNFNNHIGLPLGLLRLPLDTQTAIIEMGMNHPGEIRFLASIARPHAAVITNVGTAHIGILGSIAAIAEAKGEILEELPAEGYAVLDGESPSLATLKAKTRARIITFGFSPDCSIAGSGLELSPRCLSLDVKHGSERARLRLNLLGKHNAANALAALAVFTGEGHSLADGVARLESFQPVAARMESHAIDGMRVILDCYNANPSSMKQAVDFLSLCQGRRIAVLGDMRELGAEAERFHTQLGESVADSGVDLLVAVGEDAQNIAEGALKGKMPPQQVISCRHGEEAVRVLQTLLRAGDTVLLKASRGMHFETIVKQVWPSLPCDLH